MNKRTSTARNTAAKGFTLLELIVVVAIIGILMAIAIPGYLQYQLRSNRVAMQADLSMLATLLERRFSENGFYTTTRDSNECIDLSQLPYFNEGPRDRARKVYAITFVGECDVSRYALRATPTGPQEEDGFLQLESTGRKWRDVNDNKALDDGEDHW